MLSKQNKTMTHYFEHLERQLNINWDKALLSDYNSDSFTGKDIVCHIASLHSLFESTGLQKGDKAALYGSNCARWGIAFLAVNTYKAVAVPLLSDFRPEDASSLAGHSEAKIIFVHRASWDKMDKSLMPSLKAAVSLEDFSVIWVSNGYMNQDFCKKRSPACANFSLSDGSQVAVINYTSGTTSAPKGVMLTFDNFSTNVEFALDHIQPEPGDRIVSMLPMAHMYGFMFEFLYPLCGGVHVHFFGKTPTPALLSQALREIKPFLLITVPLVMEKIFKSSVLPIVSQAPVKWLMSIPGISHFLCRKIRLKLLAAFGGNVRQIVMGGAALNPEVEKWFKKLHLPYTVGYGMTEAAPLLAYEWWQQYAPGSCGKVADRCEVRIDSPDPEHIAGEILARGRNITVGYYKNEEATFNAFTKDGWFRTGDLGVIDSKGNIFIRGRSKNMILSSNGQNIYPEEIEAIINSMPNVLESVVVERKNGLTALIYADSLPENLLQKVNLKLPAYSRIRNMELVPAPFEKTPKQSIKRFLYK